MKTQHPTRAALLGCRPQLQSLGGLETWNREESKELREFEEKFLALESGQQLEFDSTQS